ncbi:unnamed protein product [Hermetia illucens]|uniref:C2H2-type domain-containing protein n=1 Tax=Hermetia illucens TaxID=343691 RepID=A0A7R8UW53_HERIL|nr:histone H4 transcription factor [Hermetia illucens]CAD7087641.1 unnamed protein product [Hermetia illucens]
MRTKRKAPKRVQRKSKRDVLKFNSEKYEASLRCVQWVMSQKAPRQPRGVNQDLTENTEEVVADSATSLSFLKSRNANTKCSVYFSCEWKQCSEEFEKEDKLCDHVVKHIVELKPIADKYCCEWDLCYFETTCNEEITRHIHYHAYHTVLKTFGESICQTGNIPRCTNDSRNRNDVPELKNDFVCEWENCARTFKSIFAFHQHVKLHCTFEYELQALEREKKSQMFECKWEGCESKFNVVYRLSEHVRKHTNEKIVGCYHCGGIFRSNTILFNHCKRQLANNTQEYQCAECFKYFASERLLRQHVVVHVNRLKCTMCNMTCNNLYSLSKHIRYRHLNERPFGCTFCDRGFVCKADLSKHIERIHEKKVYECAEAGCDFSCKALFLLKRHDAEVHGNSPAIYACHCCEKMYKTGKTLSKHLIRVHGFQLPPGHSRFWYRIDENGLYRLQTMRIESLEVTKQILSPTASRPFSDDEQKGEEITDKGVLVENCIDLSLAKNNVANNILVTISDVDEEGNIVGTKFVNASEIKLG